MQSDHTIKGIAILIFATIFLGIQDAITKHLAQTMSVFQIVCIRFFVFSLFAIGFAAKHGGIAKGFRSANKGLQIFRGLLIATEIAVFAVALRHLGLAKMHTLVACFPLLITAMSVPLLNENVGWRRWLAVFTGFISTVIIIRPGVGVFDPYALIALAAALMFAIYNILTRKVSRTDSLATSMLYFGVVGFVASLTTMPFVWKNLTTDESFWLLIISLAAIIGHICLMKALELVPAAVLQPFNYFVLVWAILIGYVVYGEILDSVSLVGAAIVVASGIFITRREYRLSRT